MSCKGFRYEYKLSSKYPAEGEAVIDAYTQAGWEYAGILPEDDDTELTHIVFEWPYDRPPIYPHVSWP